MQILAKVKAAAGAAVAAAMIFGASPAYANSSNAADVAAPLRAAQEARQSALGNGDQEFRSLFSTWQSLDKGPQLAASSTQAPVRRVAIGAVGATSSVSIPSRMPLETARFTSDYGMRTHPILGGRRGHKGVDLAAPTGTPIFATADGTVSQAEWFSSYGLYVALEHGGQLQTRYGHMSRLNVAPGQRVRKGDIIGYVGSTGRSTGPHLHYEVRVAGVAVNPAPYMQAAQFQNTTATLAGQAR